MRFNNRIVPLILSICGTIGTGFLVWEVARKSPEIKEKLDNAAEEKGEPLTLKEKVTTVGKDCAPALALFVASQGCNIAGAVIGQKQNGALASLMAVAQGQYKKNESKIKQMLLKQAKEEAKDEGIPEKFNEEDDGKELFWDEFNGFYRAREVDILYAFKELNKKFVNYEPVALSSFYAYASIELNDDKREEIEKLGWSVPQFEKNGMDEWGYYLLDVEIYKDQEVDGRKCNTVSMIYPDDDYLTSFDE